MEFPAYRKYKNDLSFFRIDSPEELTELKIMGSRYQVYHISAKILPERVFIGDLLNEDLDYCGVISAKEYEEKMEWCKENLRVL